MRPSKTVQTNCFQPRQVKVGFVSDLYGIFQGKRTCSHSFLYASLPFLVYRRVVPKKNNLPVVSGDRRQAKIVVVIIYGMCSFFNFPATRAAIVITTTRKTRAIITPTITLLLSESEFCSIKEAKSCCALVTFFEFCEQVI